MTGRIKGVKLSNILYFAFPGLRSQICVYCSFILNHGFFQIGLNHRFKLFRRYHISLGAEAHDPLFNFIEPCNLKWGQVYA